MDINTIFETGSDALTAYLTDNPVGKKIQGGAGRVWTVIKVNTDESIPPNPSTGTASTKVTLVVN
jgi:hypothetical protein